MSAPSKAADVTKGFMNYPIYLGTILLEPNRWPDRPGATYSRLRRLSGIGQGPPRVKVSERWRRCTRAPWRTCGC